MKSLLPPCLLLLLLHTYTTAHASPSPALLSADYEISLVPRNTLFLRQLSDLQTFTSALGGARASAITNSGDPQRPFSVDGQTFEKFESAAQRSCDRQFQECQKVANGDGGGGSGSGGGNQASASGNGGGGGGGGGGQGNGQNRNGGGGGGGGRNQVNTNSKKEGNNSGNNNGGNDNKNNNNGNQQGNNKNKNKNRQRDAQNGSGGVTVQQCEE